jgi:sterol desaturase/sphingolipid hydroxylase (fatty acid hydroxylase superfamily)
MIHADDTAFPPPPRAPHRQALLVGVGLTVYLAAAYLTMRLLVPERAASIWTAIRRAVTTSDTWKPAPYFAALLLVLMVDLVTLGWSRSALRHLFSRSRSARADLLVAALHWSGWSTMLMTAFSGGILMVAGKLVRLPGSLALASVITPAWLQILVVFLVIDGCTYWYHRIAHEVEFLWEAHKYHHAATSFTILTGNRIHALDEVCREVIILIPLAMLGVSVPMYVAVRYVILAFDMLQHSMVPWSYGWFGRWVLFSPIGHRIHHSMEREHWDCNYGDILVIWDRLFGTWYAGEQVNDRVDVSDNPYNTRAVAVEYLDCAARCVRALVTSLQTGRWRTEYQRQRRLHVATTRGEAANE